MPDVLIRQVGDTQDGAFLDGPFDFRVLVDSDGSHLEASVFIFLNHLGLVDFHFLHLECALDHVDVVPHVVLQVGVFLGGLPHSEDVVLLHVPNVAFGKCL